MLHTKTVHRFYFYNFPKKSWKICSWRTCWKVFCHQVTPPSIRDDNTDQGQRAQDGLLSAKPLRVWCICHVKNHSPKPSSSTLSQHGEDLQHELKETWTVPLARKQIFMKIKTLILENMNNNPNPTQTTLPWHPAPQSFSWCPWREHREMWMCWPELRGDALPSRRGLVLTAVTVVTTVPQGITVRSFSILVASTGEETCLAFSSLGSIKEN